MIATSAVALPSAPQERELVHDSALPGLRELLDRETLLRRVAEIVPQARAGKLTIRYVRYLPGEECRILVEVPTAAQTSALVSYRLAAGAVDPECHMFPEDPAMKVLGRLEDLQIFKWIVEARLREETGQAWEVRTGASSYEVVRYKPGHRCVLRLQLRVRAVDGGAMRRLRLFAHFADSKSLARTFAVHRALHGRTGSEGPLALTRPIAYDDDRNLLLEEEVTGTPLAQHMDREDAKKVVKRLAKRLVDIHRQDYDPGRRLEIRGAMAEIEAVGRHLEGVPGISCEWVHLAVARFRQHGETCATAPAPEALVHGDFHHCQVIVKGRRAWIVDFDRVTRGDPLIDVGSFLGHLALDSREGFLPEDSARKTAKSFLRGYAGAWPEAMGRDRLRWWAGWFVLRSAGAPFRQLQPCFLQRIHDRVDLAMRLLAGEWIPPVDDPATRP